MKRILICILLMTGIVFAQPGFSQVSVHVNVGIQPAWGPAGYGYAEYYYVPDIHAFYWVQNQEFVYFNGYQWIYSPYPPPGYSDIDLFNCYKVVINSPRPWLRYHYYAGRYDRFRGFHGQAALHPDFDHRGYAERGRVESGNRRGPVYAPRQGPTHAPRQQGIQRNQPVRQPHGGYRSAPQQPRQAVQQPRSFSNRPNSPAPARSNSRASQGHQGGNQRHGR
ncbi:MAG TPA: hypothetical protein VMV20_08260 [Chitinophagaceae bacterium]|nr:hypothetical protein [Chitinophagaceae bacterium]